MTTPAIQKRFEDLKKAGLDLGGPLRHEVALPRPANSALRLNVLDRLRAIGSPPAN